MNGNMLIGHLQRLLLEYRDERIDPVTRENAVFTRLWVAVPELLSTLVAYLNHGNPEQAIALLGYWTRLMYTAGYERGKTAPDLSKLFGVEDKPEIPADGCTIVIELGDIRIHLKFAGDGNIYDGRIPEYFNKRIESAFKSNFGKPGLHDAVFGALSIPEWYEVARQLV